jgi:hypothetical protein
VKGRTGRAYPFLDFAQISESVGESYVDSGYLEVTLRDTAEYEGVMYVNFGTYIQEKITYKVEAKMAVYVVALEPL